MNYTNKELRDAAHALDQLYHDSRDAGANVSYTLDRFFDAVGHDLGTTVIALLIKENAWDGRISGESVDWARGVTADDFPLYTNIHMCHLEQLARELR